MLNLSILQDSLIAFKNEAQVDAFAYVDKKNAKRVGDIRELISGQQADLDQVVHIMNEVKKYVDRNTDIIADFEKVWAEMHVVRRDKIIEMI